MKLLRMYYRELVTGRTYLITKYQEDEHLVYSECSTSLFISTAFSKDYLRNYKPMKRGTK